MSLRATVAIAVLCLTGVSQSADLRALAPGSSWKPAADPFRLQYRILKIIENEQRRHVLAANEPVLAPTCIQAPTISDFFDLSDINQARDVAAATLPDLSAPAAKINDVFNVLRATRWGAAVMKKFYPKFGFEIRIDHFSEEMKRTEAKRGRRAAAVYDVDARTIYVNRSEEIGTVAPILLHEIVHSLDGDFLRSVERERQLWKDFDRDVNNLLREVSLRVGKPGDDLLDTDFRPDELVKMSGWKTRVEQFRDIRIYRAERIAYDMYFNILAELIERFPQYYGTQRKGLARFDDEELVRTEGLNAETIRRYRKGLCRTRL